MAEAEKLDFVSRCDGIQKHFKMKIYDPVLQKELSEILDRTTEAYDDRHSVIHAVFAHSLPDGELQRYFKKKPTKTDQPKGEHLDPGVKELDTLRNRLRRARDDLHFFTKKHFLSGSI